MAGIVWAVPCNCIIFCRIYALLNLHLQLYFNWSEVLGFAECGTGERKLLNDLMAYYQKLERPVANESEAVQLRFGLTLQQIMDVVSETSNFLMNKLQAIVSHNKVVSYQQQKNRVLFIETRVGNGISKMEIGF